MTTQTRTTRQRSKPALTFADLQAKIRRPQRIAEVVLDAEAAAQIDALGEVLDRARVRDEVLGGDLVAPDVARKLQDAEERAEASRVQLVFEAIPHTAYKELIDKHPATAEQVAQRAEVPRSEQWPFDPDSFAPELVKAQLIDPQSGTDEEFAAFWAALSDGQLRHLWATALDAQTQITVLGPRSQAAAELVKAIADTH